MSRRCIRSFGESPLTRKPAIDLFSPASSVATCETSPPAPAIEVYWSCAALCASTSCERTAAIESVSDCACPTSAVLADGSAAVLDRSDQEVQNLSSIALTPEEPGS